MLRALLSIVLAAPTATAFAVPIPKELKGNSTYFPTAVGAKWVYEMPDGGLEAAVVSAVEKDGDELIVSREGADGTQTVYSKMIVSADGLRQERLGADGVKVGWVLKTRLKSGDSWDAPEGGRRTVHGPEEVQVPAGKFKALRVAWEQGGATYKSWFAPGVGEVMRVETRGETEIVLRALRSFKLKDEK